MCCLIEMRIVIAFQTRKSSLKVHWIDQDPSYNGPSNPRIYCLTTVYLCVF